MADWDDNRDDPHGGDAAYMLWPHKLLVGAVQQSGWCGEVHPNNSAPWDSFKSIEQCNTSTKIGCLFNVSQLGSGLTYVAQGPALPSAGAQHFN